MRLRWNGIRGIARTAAPLSNPKLEGGIDRDGADCANFVPEQAWRRGIGKIFIQDFIQYSCGFSGFLAPGRGVGACKVG
jgi:hypothetical protein